MSLGTAASSPLRPSLLCLPLHALAAARLRQTPFDPWHQPRPRPTASTSATVHLCNGLTCLTQVVLPSKATGGSASCALCSVHAVAQRTCRLASIVFHGKLDVIQCKQTVQQCRGLAAPRSRGGDSQFWENTGSDVGDLRAAHLPCQITVCYQSLLQKGQSLLCR